MAHECSGISEVPPVIEKGSVVVIKQLDGHRQEGNPKSVVLRYGNVATFAVGPGFMSAPLKEQRKMLSHSISGIRYQVEIRRGLAITDVPPRSRRIAEERPPNTLAFDGSNAGCATDFLPR